MSQKKISYGRKNQSQDFSKVFLATNQMKLQAYVPCRQTVCLTLLCPTQSPVSANTVKVPVVPVLCITVLAPDPAPDLTRAYTLILGESVLFPHSPWKSRFTLQSYVPPFPPF